MVTLIVSWMVHGWYGYFKLTIPTAQSSGCVLNGYLFSTYQHELYMEVLKVIEVPPVIIHIGCSYEINPPTIHFDPCWSILGSPPPWKPPISCHHFLSHFSPSVQEILACAIESTSPKYKRFSTWRFMTCLNAARQGTTILGVKWYKTIYIHIYIHIYIMYT